MNQNFIPQEQSEMIDSCSFLWDSKHQKGFEKKMVLICLNKIHTPIDESDSSVKS
jgi:hypothetical protein